MFRPVNATLLVPLALLAVLPACGPSRTGSDDPPDRRPAAPAAPVADAAPGTSVPPPPRVPATPPGIAAQFREESARWIPEPYHNLYLGETLALVREDYPDLRPYPSPSDPERLQWFELQGPNGLVLRLGFNSVGTPDSKLLRSVQFLSLLQGSVPTEAPADPRALAAWQEWIARAYGPHVQALREKYGERADVYTCAGTGDHPVVRLIWRGEAVAVTAAFLLHDKGLSSTLMFTPLDVAERYIKATQCRWLQDRVL
jgi:hypothetical protein